MDKNVLDKLYKYKELYNLLTDINNFEGSESEDYILLIYNRLEHHINDIEINECYIVFIREYLILIISLYKMDKILSIIKEKEIANDLYKDPLFKGTPL